MNTEEKPFPIWESFPIDVEHPEEFLGHEFLLAIYARAGVMQRAKSVTQNLVNRVRGKEQVKVRASYDDLMEVAERTPLRIRGYHWPYIDQVTLEDGTSVGSTIPASERCRRYIFVPRVAQVTQGNGYRLEGMMWRYSLFNNSLDGLGQRVAIQYKNPPQHKTSGVDIGCMVV